MPIAVLEARLGVAGNRVNCSDFSVGWAVFTGPARGDRQVSEPKITSCLPASPAGASPYLTPRSPALCPTTCWTPSPSSPLAGLTAQELVCP